MKPEENVERLANAKLGVPSPQAAPQAAPPPQPAPETDMEKAAKAGAPVTEGDQSQESPVMYRVKFGDNDERELTPDQIKGVFNRYAQLNDVHTQMRPVLAMTAKVLRDNPGMTPEGMVEAMVALANRHNPQMGGEDERPNTEKKPVQSADDVSKQFEAWEKENAASLPPGYKDLFSGTSAMQQQMQQMMAMMQQVLGRTAGMTDASRAAAQDARTQTIQARQQRIANNLNAVQQKLNLTDDNFGDFRAFAAERGYDMSDFLDPMLTLRVANDFKNALQSGEMSRLKEIHARRQAFTGAAAAPPSAASGKPADVDANLERLIARKMG